MALNVALPVTVPILPSAVPNAASHSCASAVIQVRYLHCQDVRKETRDGMSLESSKKIRTPEDEGPLNCAGEREAARQQYRLCIVVLPYIVSGHSRLLQIPRSSLSALNVSFGTDRNS